jgi:hypothetical protein
MIRSREQRNRRARDEGGLVRREIVAMNRSERSFARSHGKPHASCSRGSGWCNDKIGLR